MVFSGLVFLTVFLPIVLILYYICHNRTYRNIVLVIASLVFYAWGEPVWVLALLFSGALDYTCGRLIEKYHGRWQSKAALLSSLIINIGILGVFKYSGFFVSNINALFGFSIPVPDISMPLGISFYTFQTLSYTIDMYRGDCRMQKSWLSYMAYLSMFPQLVAGPIVRYVDITEQLEHRVTSLKSFSDGAVRFIIGLGKKVMLANMVGNVATMLLDGDLTVMPAASAWLGIIAYTFQIYFDFSGYSDMAIGLGKMLGFDFYENFNYPYIAKSVTDFWRRWHISLSSFFRDYVYIPLGGNRYRQWRNILIVWLLTGFWHGASWNFVLWGLYYGLLLIVEKKLFGGVLTKLPRPICYIYNLVIVIFGWSLFYYTDMSRWLEFIERAFMIGDVPLYNVSTLSVLLSNIWLLLVCAIASTPVPKLVFNNSLKRSKAAEIAQPIMLMALYAGCFVLLVGQTYNPFLYFRF